MRHGHGLTTSSRNPQQQQQQQRQRQRHSTQTLVSFPFFSFSFFSSSFLEFGPRPDELGTRVKPWRGPAPFEFVTPGIEQHRDRSDGTRYNSFSIPPSELNVAPGEPLEIAWPSGRGERGGKRFKCRDWTTIFSFYSGCYEIVEGPPAYLCSYSSPFSFFRIFLHRISETIETSTISFMRVFLLGFRIPITLPIIFSSAFYSNFLTS